MVWVRVRRSGGFSQRQRPCSGLVLGLRAAWCVFLSWEEEIISWRQLAEKRLPYICDLVENKSKEWGPGWGQPLHDVMPGVTEVAAERRDAGVMRESGRRSENMWNDNIAPLKGNCFVRGLKSVFCRVWYHFVAVLMKIHSNHRALMSL